MVRISMLLFLKRFHPFPVANESLNGEDLVLPLIREIRVEKNMFITLNNKKIKNYCILEIVI